MSAQMETRASFATIEEAIDYIRQGKMVVVVDAADLENEGDLLALLLGDLADDFDFSQEPIPPLILDPWPLR